MNTDKFTLRDFFVFFLSGISLLFGLCITQYEWMIKIYKGMECADTEVLSLIKAFPTMFGLLSIPMLYLIGQLIHGVDDLIFTNKWINYFDRQNDKPRFISWLYEWLIGYRVIGYVWINYKKNETKNGRSLANLSKDEYSSKRIMVIESFWQEFYTLQSKNLSLPSEYWYIMNELFKGLSLTCLVLGFLPF